MKEKEFIETDTKSLRSQLTKYLRYWYLFIGGLIISIGIAKLYLYYSTPVYNITSTILIKGNAKGSEKTDNAVVNDLEDFKNTVALDDQVNILKSKSLMRRALTDLSLQVSYKVEDKVKENEIFGRELPFKIITLDTLSIEIEESITIKVKSKTDFELKEKSGKITNHKFDQEVILPYGKVRIVPQPNLSSFIDQDVIITFHDYENLTNHYREALTVEIANKVNKEANVIDIAMTETIPGRGKLIVNKLIEIYNKDATSDKNLIALNTIQLIDDRLTSLTSELSSVEKRVENYKRKNDITDVSSEATLYLENNSEYNKQLSKIAIELEVLNSLQNYLGKSKQNNIFSVIPSTLSIQDPTLTELISNYNELQMERERMLRTSLPNNPLVQNISEQLNTFRNNILETIKSTRKELTINQKNIKLSTGKFASKMQKVPVIERELLVENRQQGIKQELYLYLLQKREEATLSLAATNTSGTRVIDSANADQTPVSPNKRSVYMLAFLLGIGLPIAFIHTKGALNNNILKQSDITRLTDTPILGEITRNFKDEMLVVVKESKSPVAELFRLIRTNLQFLTKQQENKTMLVTSSQSGEGKTFFSINIGASLAMAGKKVVIIDLDLRMPSLLSDLGLRDQLGITDYLQSEDITIDQLIISSTEVDNLYFIGPGKLAKSPAELLLSPKLEYLLVELKERFNFVIMDTAPVGQVADALSLNTYTDFLIYLVRYNYTSKEHIEIINDIYLNKKFNNPLIVLNDADKRNSRSYKYGYPEKKERKKLNIAV